VIAFEADGEARSGVHVHCILTAIFTEGLLEANDLGAVGEAFFGSGNAGLLRGENGRLSIRFGAECSAAKAKACPFEASPAWRTTVR
jgi:hypothetical protein